MRVRAEIMCRRSKTRAMVTSVETFLGFKATPPPRHNEDVYGHAYDRPLLRHHLRPFCLGIPRIKLVVDGQRDAAAAACVYTWLVNLFPDERTGLWLRAGALNRARGQVHAKLRRITPSSGDLRTTTCWTTANRRSKCGRSRTVHASTSLARSACSSPSDCAGWTTRAHPAVRRYHLHVTLFADGQRRRSTAHVGAFVVDWEPVRPMVQPNASVRVTCRRFAYDEGGDDKNDGADWFIVTAGTSTPETATCTTLDASDPPSTADSLE